MGCSPGRGKKDGPGAARSAIAITDHQGPSDSENQAFFRCGQFPLPAVVHGMGSEQALVADRVSPHLMGYPTIRLVGGRGFSRGECQPLQGLEWSPAEIFVADAFHRETTAGPFDRQMRTHPAEGGLGGRANGHEASRLGGVGDPTFPGSGYTTGVPDQVKNVDGKPGNFPKNQCLGDSLGGINDSGTAGYLGNSPEKGFQNQTIGLQLTGELGGSAGWIEQMRKVSYPLNRILEPGPLRGIHSGIAAGIPPAQNVAPKRTGEIRNATRAKRRRVSKQKRAEVPHFSDRNGVALLSEEAVTERASASSRRGNKNNFQRL